MKFYLIRDIEEQWCNGVVLESETNEYGGRLSGDEGLDDPARVVRMQIAKNGGVVGRVVAGDDGARKKEQYKKGEPGFMRALLEQLRTPLVLFREGRMTKVSTAEQMSLQLWKRFANPEVEVPRYSPL